MLRPLLLFALVGALVLTGVKGVALVRADIEPARTSSEPLLVPLDGTLTFRVRSADRDVEALVDGRRVPASLSDGDLRVRPGRLPGGAHAVRISARTGGFPARTVSGTWRFSVDPVAPRLRVRAPRAVATREVRVQGTTERGASLALAHGDRRLSARAETDGRFSFTIPLSPGANRVRVSARDRAGNRTLDVRRIVRDAEPPALQLRADRLWSSDSGAVTAEVEDAGATRLTVLVDGVERHSGTAATGANQVPVGPLPDGRHLVEASATDRAGNTQRREQEVMVDSSETLGDAVIGAGARGRDVRQLLALMRRFGGYDGPARDTLDGGAVRALRAFQSQAQLEVDGLAGPAVLMALTRQLPASVTIDRSDFTLALVRGGVPVKTYTVAVGQSRYPTPTGALRVVRKERDPTWTPPDSPWAAELDTVPPGPGNPLGTRWIGLSIRSIGIHGTYATDSLGTQASHGCIRMSIPDVEELFEQLDVGTPVRIAA